MTTWWANAPFTDPKLFALWDPPPDGGVYLILARQPDEGQQVQYRPVYVGETQDFAGDVTEAHRRFGCWAQEAMGTGHLYVVVCPKEGRRPLDELHRMTIEAQLVELLDPPCNRGRRRR